MGIAAEDMRAILSYFHEETLTKGDFFLEARVFALLSMSAEERYKFLFSQNAELFQQVPLKYLASMMGITPESLSRIRKKMG